MSFNPDPEAVIPGVVKGVLNALEAASKHTSVKRFVLTSSSSAALLPPLNEEVVVDESMYPLVRDDTKQSHLLTRIQTHGTILL